MKIYKYKNKVIEERPTAPKGKLYGIDDSKFGLAHEWFDDWEIERTWAKPQSKAGSPPSVFICLPHCGADAKRVNFRSVSDPRVMWIINALEAALDSLSQKKLNNPKG